MGDLSTSFLSGVPKDILLALILMPRDSIARARRSKPAKGTLAARLATLEQRLADAEGRIARLEATRPNMLGPSKPWAPAIPQPQPAWMEPHPDCVPMTPTAPSDPYPPMRVTCAITPPHIRNTFAGEPNPPVGGGTYRVGEGSWRAGESTPQGSAANTP